MSEKKSETKLKTVEIMEKFLDPTTGFQYQKQLKKIKMVKYIKSMVNEAKNGLKRDYIVAKTILKFGVVDKVLINGLIDLMIENGDLRVGKKKEGE